jgi:hypothetical protein
MRTGSFCCFGIAMNMSLPPGDGWRELQGGLNGGNEIPGEGMQAAGISPCALKAVASNRNQVSPSVGISGLRT